MSQEIIQGDCLEVMKGFADKSFDLVLTDPPYGTTACSWDTVVPFDLMWEQILRVTKDNAAIIMTASQPFTSALVMSMPKLFKCEWIWKKNAGSNFATTKYQPMKEHESVLIFSKGTPFYNQQRQERAPSGFARQKTPLTFNRKDKHESGDVYGGIGVGKVEKKMISKDRCPSSVQSFARERGLHPTQKPVALMRYFIETYSKESDTILDPFLVSGTTLVAAKQLNRNAVGIEISPEYCEIARRRLEQDTLL